MSTSTTAPSSSSGRPGPRGDDAHALAERILAEEHIAYARRSAAWLVASTPSKAAASSAATAEIPARQPLQTPKSRPRNNLVKPRAPRIQTKLDDSYTS